MQECRKAEMHRREEAEKIFLNSSCPCLVYSKRLLRDYPASGINNPI
jgi:hypothetical protein